MTPCAVGAVRVARATMAQRVGSTPADRILRVAPSATLAMAARAAKLRAEGHRVFPFSVGEPDFDTPEHVRDAAKRALDAGATRYTPVSGTPDLKRAICEATAKYRGFSPKPSEIVVSAGAKQALFDVALALYQQGDEVIIPTPCWVSYPEQVRFANATPVLVETREEDGFRLSPDALSRALGPATKAVLLCTPSNPTGAAYDRASLGALLEVLRNHHALIVVDEIYADLVYGGFRHTSARALAPDLAERIVVIDGVSKTFAMTGWRIGWSVSSPAIAELVDKLQSQSTSNAAAVSQAAAVAALLGPRDSVEQMRATYERRRDLMVGGLASLPGVTCRLPEGAFYAFANVKGLLGKRAGDRVLESDRDLAMYFLDEAHVASVAGLEFSAPGYLRFSYACSEADIEGGVGAMRAAIERLS
jgi:aspartate aminotransferase